MNWIELKELSQLDDIKEISFSSPVAIFKHSTRCGISRMVLKSVERDLKSANKLPVRLFLLDLLAHRNISDAIAERWNVEHQSPQVLLIQNGEVLEHASHYSIDADMLLSLS